MIVVLLYKAIVYKHVLFHFQTKDIDTMCMQTHSALKMMTEASKQQTVDPVSFMCFYIG